MLFTTSERPGNTIYSSVLSVRTNRRALPLVLGVTYRTFLRAALRKVQSNIINILGVTHLVQHPTATVSRGESPEYGCGGREGRLRPHPVPRPLFAPRRWAGPGVELRRGNSSRPTQVTSDRSTDRLDGQKKRKKKRNSKRASVLVGVTRAALTAGP